MRLRHTPVRDIALLVARLGVGGAFAAHGWQKIVTNGLDATTEGMATMGVPLPRAAATFAAVVELGGGIALLLGAATAVAGLLLTVVMLGAFSFVHVGNGPFVSDRGWELVVALGTSSVFLAASGPGRISVDHLIGRLRGRAGEVVLDEEPAAELDVRAEAAETRRRSRV